MCWMDGAGCDSFDIINIFIKLCAQFLCIFFSFCINFVDIGIAQFVEVGFIF